MNRISIRKLKVTPRQLFILILIVHCSLFQFLLGKEMSGKQEQVGKGIKRKRPEFMKCPLPATPNCGWRTSDRHRVSYSITNTLRSFLIDDLIYIVAALLRPVEDVLELARNEFFVQYANKDHHYKLYKAYYAGDLFVYTDIHSTFNIWYASIRGAKGTPYAYGWIDIEIHFPSSYPFSQLLIRVVNADWIKCSYMKKDGWVQLYSNDGASHGPNHEIIAFISLLSEEVQGIDAAEFKYLKEKALETCWSHTKSFTL